MTVQYRDRVLRSREASLEAFDCLRCKRNFRDENDRAASPVERAANRLQINFRFAGACHPVKQDWARVFRRVESFGDFLQRARLLVIQNKIRSCDELFIPMWISKHGFRA